MPESGVIDSGVLVDAIYATCADAGKKICHSAVLAMTLLHDTAQQIMGDAVKVNRA